MTGRAPRSAGRDAREAASVNVLTRTRPGDIVLVHQRWNPFSWLIRLGQHLRGYPRVYAYWNHVGFVGQPRGPVPTIVEAVARGVWRTDLSEYLAHPHRYRVCVVDSGLAAPERSLLLDWLDQRLGDHYGWLEIGDDAVSVLTGIRVRWRERAHYICSELVADGLRALAGIRIASRMSFPCPADIARHYDVVHYTRRAR